MSHVIFCDLCGIELGEGKGIYHAELTAPGERRFTESCRYDLCRKCAKPLMEWKVVNPKRKMKPVEVE